MQRDEVREVINVGGRTLEIIELSRVRAERAEATAAAQTVTATNWQARAIRAEAQERQAQERAAFWHTCSHHQSRTLRGYQRRQWLMVALCALVGVLALALWAVAMGWV